MHVLKPNDVLTAFPCKSSPSAKFSELMSSFRSVNLGLVMRERRYFTAIRFPSSRLMTFQSPNQRHGRASSPLTSPTRPCRAHCPSLLRWCTPSRTETRPAPGYVCASCPVWRRVCGLRSSPLRGWSWCLRRGRRPLRVGWWSAPSNCRTATKRRTVELLHTASSTGLYWDH